MFDHIGTAATVDGVIFLSEPAPRFVPALASYHPSMLCFQSTRIFCILTLLPSWAASSFGMLGRCGLLPHHGWRQTRPGRSPPFGNLVEWRYKFKVSGTTPYKHIMSLGEYTLSSPRRCSKRALLLMFQCHLFSGRGIPKVPYLAVSVFSLGVEYSIL